MANGIKRTMRYAELKARLAEILNGGTVAEPPGALPARAEPVAEMTVQTIWNEQLLFADRLRTCSKKPLRVIEPGRWNAEAGPDFLGADLEIGDRRVRGDVEIHVASGDWEKHRHHRDFEYNRVVLHAFLHRSDAVNFDSAHNGETIERIELAPFINPDLDTVLKSLGAEDCGREVGERLGRCHEAVTRVETGFLRDFFREAARERIEAKVARFAVQADSETPDEALYQAMLTAMGHKGGKTLFFLLAKRAPIGELKLFLARTPGEELADAIEAVMLHVANLATPASTPAQGEPCDGPPLDDETQAYLDRMGKWWSALGGYYGDRSIPPTRRWFAGIRPASFPSRRIAGVARLLADLDFRRGILDELARRVGCAMARAPKSARDFAREIRALATMFEAEGESYWSRRFTLGGKRTARPQHLIGGDRAAGLLFNALLPMLILHARRCANAPLEDFVWRLVDHFPSLPENAVTRYMRHRLFGAKGCAALNFKLERTNQALFHIFHDCCANNARSCDDCTLYRRAEAERSTG